MADAEVVLLLLFWLLVLVNHFRFNRPNIYDHLTRLLSIILFFFFRFGFHLSLTRLCEKKVSNSYLSFSCVVFVTTCTRLFHFKFRIYPIFLLVLQYQNLIYCWHQGDVCFIVSKFLYNFILHSRSSKNLDLRCRHWTVYFLSRVLLWKSSWDGSRETKRKSGLKKLLTHLWKNLKRKKVPLKN